MFPSKLQAGAWAKSLGWFSIALGAAELLAARPLAKASGLRGQQSRVRAYGAREIAIGVGLLVSRNPEPWMWARVAGDALDLATLLADGRPASRTGTRVALAAVAGVTVLDLMCTASLARSRHPAESKVDYSGRSGWPLPADEMRGAARKDFTPPPDMQAPAALRPWTNGRPVALSHGQAMPAHAAQRHGMPG